MFKLPALSFRTTKTLFFLLSTVIVVFAGCERLKNYTDIEHVQRAKEFQDKGDVKTAVIELKGALTDLDRDRSQGRTRRADKQETPPTAGSQYHLHGQLPPRDHHHPARLELLRAV